MLCGISPGFPRLSPTEGQVSHVLLTRSPLYSRSCPRFLVRLACVRHAASVDSEPGSNSRLKPDLTPVSEKTRAATRRVVSHPTKPKPRLLGTPTVRVAAMRLIMPTRVDTEFTAQPLTYFVRSLGLESSFHSRLARSTILSKINHEFRLGGSFSLLRPVSVCRPVLETCCLYLACARPWA